MKEFMPDLLQIQNYIAKAFTATGKLVSMANAEQVNPTKQLRELADVSSYFEHATLEVRHLCEQHSYMYPLAHKQGESVPIYEIAGTVNLLSERWLHIRMECLLPHCQYHAPSYLSDTLRRLLDDFQREHKAEIPFFEHAVLIIDEHSNIANRQIYDQDNKGWKVVPNALKGRVIADDDQYHMDLVLLSKASDENVTHITILDFEDVADFFSLRASDYTSETLYRGR